MTEHVIINGDVLFYKDKAPFMSSGYSVRGALEYNLEDDKVQCHECDGAYRMLAAHVTRRHGMTVREYKLRHGLRQKTALVGDRLRKQFILETLRKRREGILCTQGFTKQQSREGRKTGTTLAARSPKSYGENTNLQGTCHAQLLQRLREVAEKVGHTPTNKELGSAGISNVTLTYKFGSVRKALEQASLSIEGRKPGCGWQKYSDKYLLKAVQLFKHQHGRRPTTSDFDRGDVGASAATYALRFGSLTAALRKAGCWL